MTLRHLQIFRTVCDLESVTAAAEKLRMTQPAVSVAIRELETFYNVRLFERMNRRIYVTEAGRTLLQYADTVLGQFDESVAVLRDGGAISGCRFGVNVTVGETLLPELLSYVGKASPEYSVTACVENARTIENLLTHHEIDFAIVDQLPPGENWHSEQLSRTEMKAFCRPDFAPPEMTVEALAERPLLLREAGSGSRELIDAMFHRHGCQVRPVVESGSTLCLISLAVRGIGVTVLPPVSVERELREGVLTAPTVTNDSLVRRFYLVWHRNKYRTKAMCAVIDAARRCCL